MDELSNNELLTQLNNFLDNFNEIDKEERERYIILYTNELNARLEKNQQSIDLNI